MHSLVESLKSKALVAECPKCGEEFRLSEAFLFDGTRPFPARAEEKRRECEETLRTQTTALNLRRIRADVGAARTTAAVQIGQMVEHIVPVLKDFGFQPADCRPLFNPIDFIVFNGLTQSKVTSLTFMDIKTGGAGLNRHQQLVEQAIQKRRVFYEEV